MDSGNIVERLCLPLMAHEPADRFLVITRAFEGLAALEPDRARREKYAGFIGYYAAVEKSEKAELFDKYICKSPYGEEIMTLGQVLHDEGVVEGTAKGMVDAFLELYKKGVLTAAQAREQLLSLVQRGAAPQELVEQALKKIQN
ncbi:MAG TPA: hypothetical protein VKX17_20100 [Planctomycetota bacterium]|nr:hypothetical protein [Planctomycetota bacterium]